MMYSNLLEYIDLAVTENGNQEITGKVMNAVLKTMVEQLGAGYQFAGVVEPATEPTLNQAALFWLAFKSGAYTHFKNVIVPDGSVGVFMWDGETLSTRVITFSDFPLRGEVLLKGGKEPYSPTEDYDPATKKYVDDEARKLQPKTDESLQTSDKTVAGAINELKASNDSKQDKLKAGTGVEITSDNTVNVTLDTTVFKVVASLPESPAAGDENKIHLVPAESTEEGNIYTEYVYVNGKWEEFGTYRSEVDLTPYMKKADVEATYQKITDNALSTTAKTVVGAINENTGNVTRIDRAVGNPVIEEVDLTQIAEAGHYWSLTGVKSSNADYSLVRVTLQKGDLLIASVMTSGSVAQLTVVDEAGANAVELVPSSKGEGSLIVTSSYYANKDCKVDISQYDAGAIPGTKAYIIKSPFNTVISDNSYMQYLHKMYEEYGAVYNAETGYWELNGLTDLTEEDMRDIYNASLTAFNSFSYDGATLVGVRYNNTFRTLMDKYPSVFYSATNHLISGFAAFQRCSNMETLCVGKEGNELQLYGPLCKYIQWLRKIKSFKIS